MKLSDLATRIAVLSAAALILAFGLCTATIFTVNGHKVLGNWTSAGFAVCTAAGVLGLVTAVVLVIISSFQSYSGPDRPYRPPTTGEPPPPPADNRNESERDRP
jgi:uncharacterized membrane protein YphA (DoxX/SURF4 family)